jgi:hypothetical protein
MSPDHILRDNWIYGMNSDFESVLNGHCGTISDYVSNFTYNTVSLKTQHILMSTTFSKSVQNMEEKFGMARR